MRKGYITRYLASSAILGNVLTQLDKQTEILMLNAARVVSAWDRDYGTPSESILRGMLPQLGITHLFIINKDGEFIRSTNPVDKKFKVPSLYSFCKEYKKLITGGSSVQATPILYPKPEPRPHKFLSIPNYNRSRIIEVGMRVDFITKTLTGVLASDSNLLSLSLYDPDGISFGEFSAERNDFKKDKIQLPNIFPKVVETKDTFQFFSRVTSSHPYCCQCQASKISKSKDDEYYYILKSEISKKGFLSIQSSMKAVFYVLAFAALLLFFILSRVISLRLVRNIEELMKKIKAIQGDGQLSNRIYFKGEDEIAYIAQEFNKLLDTLEISQKKVIEGEKLQVKVQLAKEVAHNMRSPALAIEMMMPLLTQLPVSLQKVLRDSARDIKKLAEKLNFPVSFKTDWISLSETLERIVFEKKIEYSSKVGIQVNLIKDFQIEELKNGVYVRVDLLEFRAVISNLINNAVESYSGGEGIVEICYQFVDESKKECVIKVSDHGIGIPKEFLSQLKWRRVSFGKKLGTGIGLFHAHHSVLSWNGSLSIDSTEGHGTTVSLILPISEMLSSFQK